MIVCEDGTAVFGTDDARDYLSRHGVPSHRIDDFAVYEAQYDGICCIVDDIAASIDAALSKQRITGARELLRSIRDTLEEMTGR